MAEEAGELSVREWTDDDLRSIKTVEDAIQQFEAVTDVKDVLGTGFDILNDKDRLVGAPFMIVTAREHKGDFGRFVTCFLVTDNGDRWIINDGSTGIAAQLLSLKDSHGITDGILVKEGLRRSDYTFTAEDGSEKDASTYYLST